MNYQSKNPLRAREHQIALMPIERVSEDRTNWLAWFAAVMILAVVGVGVWPL